VVARLKRDIGCSAANPVARMFDGSAKRYDFSVFQQVIFVPALAG
jgi:hypothetical protein